MSEKKEVAIDLSGMWTFHGHPWNAPNRGRISVEIKQEGYSLTGTLVQAISPATGQAPQAMQQTEAEVKGEIIPHPDTPLIIIKRLNLHDDFRAVFAGAYHQSQDTITGMFRNSNPGGGSFVMERETTSIGQV